MHLLYCRIHSQTLTQETLFSTELFVTIEHPIVENNTRTHTSSTVLFFFLEAKQKVDTKVHCSPLCFKTVCVNADVNDKRILGIFVASYLFCSVLWVCVCVLRLFHIFIFYLFFSLFAFISSSRSMSTLSKRSL